jgi:hypothetical protein
MPDYTQPNAALDLQGGMTTASYPFAQKPSQLAPQDNAPLEMPTPAKMVKFPAVITSEEARKMNLSNIARVNEIDMQMQAQLAKRRMNPTY